MHTWDEWSVIEDLVLGHESAKMSVITDLH